MKDSTKKPSTSIRMSTAPVKKVKPPTDAPIPKTLSIAPAKSSMSVVNSVKTKISKKKPRTEESSTRKLNKVKDRALAEESEALEIISKLKTKCERSNENDHLEVYNTMYTQLRRIIRKTEKGCLRSKTGQGAYQLATLYTQLRETIACITSLTSLEDHSDILIEKVMQPLFTTLAQQLANSMYIIKLKIKDKLQEKRVRRCFEDIDEITIEAAKHLQDEYLKTCENIKKMLF